MPHLTIHGCHFEGFRFTVGPKRGEGAPMVIVDFCAAWSAANRGSGGWEEIPETVSGLVNLVPGELAASRIDFAPQKGMEAHAFGLECAGAEGFQVFVPTKEGQDRELRFQVMTPSNKAEKILGTFGRTAGRIPGKLKISYSENAKTDEINATPEQQAAQREIPTEG
jgi:hypothetical protein